MGQQETIYFGRFVSAPTPNELLIRTGAVLVDSKNGKGVITKADWTIDGPDGAVSKFGVEAPVVTSKDNGFFFPGFIGRYLGLFPRGCSEVGEPRLFKKDRHERTTDAPLNRHTHSCFTVP
jgi:hypothetical protein